jgi:hypothetical protein
MRTKEVVDKLQCFIGRIGDFEQGQIGFWNVSFFELDISDPIKKAAPIGCP